MLRFRGIAGSWIISKGSLTENYELSSYHSNYVRFYGDTIELASGFFYNTMGTEDEYPNGRYPFVYYGNRERFAFKGDKLSIFSRPYNEWNSFDVQCVTRNKIVLINNAKSDTAVLERVMNSQTKHVCNIKSIKAHVHKASLDLYNVGYKVSFASDDTMIYEQQDSASENFSKNVFKLREGTFEDICEGFKYVKLNELQRIYPANISEFKTVDVEIEMVDGRKVKCAIENVRDDNAPDELRLALVPVLYLYHRFMYSHLPAKRFNDR